MPSSFSNYLLPANSIALGIVICLFCFFIAWLVGLIAYWRILSKKREQIENNQDIQPLVTARQKRDRDDNEAKTDANPVFQDFCEERYLSENSFISRHLKAIFLAGWDESRLEVSELINHTTSNLFRWNNLFRSVLAVFIVIGLLGTLFGLTDSLVELSSALGANAETQTSIENGEVDATTVPPTENSEEMTKALGNLMGDIKGAFAPSIWGIIFTIAGVIFYGIHLQIACHPVKSILEQSTLTVWVPQLYPTTSQKLIQTLQESEAQMRSGYQTAVRIDELVETVQTNVNEFNTSLTQAKSITQPLSESGKEINKAASAISTAAADLNTGFTKSLNEFSDVLDKGLLERLNKFSEEFASSVSHLAGFQDDIRSLYQQFQEAANQRLDQHSEKVNEQNQNLIKVLNALNSYEQASINSRKQIDEKLQAFIDRATETNTSIYTENQEWFEKINTDNQQQFSEMQNQLKTELGNVQQTLENQLNALTEKLGENLGNVEQDLNDGLTMLNERLENFDTPLKQTAEDIKGVFDNRLETLNERLEKFPEPIQQSANQIRDTYADSVTNMRGIVNDLQQEINKQNEKYEEQLTGVKGLNERVEGLLTQLGESSRNQKHAIDEIKDTFDNRLETLNKQLEKFPEPIQQSANQMRDTYTRSITDMKEMVGNLQEEINELNKKYEKQLTGVQSLNQDLVNLLNQLDARLENFGKPLRETVGEIKDTFDVQLTTLNERLEKFDEPIQGAAEQMRDTYADSVTYMQGIVGDLQREINEQNQKYAEQLAGVKGLNERVEGLLTQLDDSSRNQKHAVDALSTNIGGLTEDVKSLDTAINALTSDSGDLHQSIAAIKEYTGTLGAVSQQFVEKNESVVNLLSQLGESSSNQKEAVNALSTNVGGLTTDVKNLDSAIKSFVSDSGNLSQSIKAIKGNIETLSTASQQFVEKMEKADVTPLNANIDELNTTISKIAQTSQTLVDAVNGLEKKRSFFGIGRK